MLSKEEILIIEELVNKFICKKYADDFKQELYIIVLELEIEKLDDIRLNNKFPNFIYGILRNQYFSYKSNFYKKYKRWDKNRDDINNE